MIKEKAHPSIRKKKLKGLRAAGQTGSIKNCTKIIPTNKDKILKLKLTSEESLGKKESTEKA